MFNPRPTIFASAITPGRSCVVVDDALLKPEELLEWAAGQQFKLPLGYPYPGLVLDVPSHVSQAVMDHFNEHIRRRLGARRTLDATIRFSLVTLKPSALAPLQWQCHRDRVSVDPQRVLFAAMVLYLFRDSTFGGTSFYQPRQSRELTDRMIADSHVMDASSFGDRYGLSAGYMDGSNQYFERALKVAARWNRAIYYDGSLFHSADTGGAQAFPSDPRFGRLTLNGFFTCQRNLG